MFVEFFLKGKVCTVLLAWFGLCVVVGYSAFLAWTRSRINDIYGSLYDLLGTTPSLDLVDHDLNGTLDASSGIDVVESSDDDAWTRVYELLRLRVMDQLWEFFLVVLPLVIVTPVARYLRSVWTFSWRLQLIRSYLKVWDPQVPPIEGASQRVHEDTGKFARALDTCIATVLDAVCTLAVFSGKLVDLSSQIKPPLSLGPLDDCWLMLAAILAAFVGLGVSMVVGRHLVHLEVNNQRVEAGLRRELVLLEVDPSSIMISSARQPGAVSGGSPLIFFGMTLSRLSKNYHALFRQFTLLNLWLSGFDQVMVLFPFVCAAPLVFASVPSDRITLGVLVQLANCFDRVFSSLSIVSESWGAINEFRATVVRLREFEVKIYKYNRPVSNCLLPEFRDGNSSSEHDDENRSNGSNGHDGDVDDDGPLHNNNNNNNTARTARQPPGASRRGMRRPVIHQLDAEIQIVEGCPTPRGQRETTEPNRSV
jgi:ABC-type long-subunit fatty acid transport system fused permease/ATPase subunit